jgi:hypothetical protein
MPGVDLHTHSTASDGSLAPGELVAVAKKAGLQAVALTDHDTLDGLAEARAAGRELGIEVVPGCELSAESDAGRMDVVGLWVPEKPGRLSNVLDELNSYRHNRNRIIADLLNELGLDISYERVREIAGEGSVGRPHFARALLEAGFVKNVQEAFDRYLGARGKAYAPKRVLSAMEAIGLLKEEGALAILAHPFQFHMSARELEPLVRRLREWGLDGIEAYYPEHTQAMTRDFVALADKLGLALSGGSDFHGAAKPSIRLGVGKGGLRIPYKILDNLKALRRSQGLATP